MQINSTKYLLPNIQRNFKYLHMVCLNLPFQKISYVTNLKCNIHTISTHTNFINVAWELCNSGCFKVVRIANLYTVFQVIRTPSPPLRNWFNG